MHDNLREVANNPGTMPFLIDALKKKGVRLDELSFGDGEITYLNQNVVILRSPAYEVIHRAFHGEKCGLTGKKMRQRNLCLCGCSKLATRFLNCFRVYRKIVKMIHKLGLRAKD
jgi:hypothetical protein